MLIRRAPRAGARASYLALYHGPLGQAGPIWFEGECDLWHHGDDPMQRTNPFWEHSKYI